MKMIAGQANFWRRIANRIATKIPLGRDLGVKLLALYLLFLGPVVLASLSFDRLASQRLESDVKNSDLALARAVALETNTFMENALTSVDNLSAYPGIVSADIEGMEPVFRDFLAVRSDVNLIYRLDRAGIMLFHYPIGPDSTVGWDFSFRDYYKRALNAYSPVVSKGRISPTTNQPVATAVMPIRMDDGTFQGLIGTNIKLQFLSHTLTQISDEQRPNSDFEIAIVDSEGQVIAHPNAANLLTNGYDLFSDVTSTVLAGQSGNLIRESPEGVEVLYSYVPIDSSQWGVIVSRPTLVAFATPRVIHYGALTALAIFLLFGLLFWIALSRQVIVPLEKMAIFSQHISQREDLSPEQRAALSQIALRPDQMGHLVRSLQQMEIAIERRLNELSTLLEISASVVSTLDPRTVLERILAQVEHLLDVDRCAIVALDQEQGRFRVQSSRGLSRRYVEHISIDPREPQSVTLRAIRTGEPIQVSDTEAEYAYSTLRHRARSEGYRAILAVPLSTKHSSPSALLVYHSGPHVFSEREIGLLTNFANHAAMAIENATLFARSDSQLQEQTRRLEALIQSLQNGLILADLHGHVLYVNRWVSDLVGDFPERIQESNLEQLVDRIATHARNKDTARHAIMAALNGRGRQNAEIALQYREDVQYLRLRVFEVKDAQGYLLGRGIIFYDITRLRELDRVKSSLISTVSHELRTPLTSIKGYATTLLAEDVSWDAGSQKEFLSVISDEADRLGELVTNLLDMSRIEAGNLTVSKELCDLTELIENAAQRALRGSSNPLNLALSPDLPRVFVDPARIEAVIRNLLENASKYGGEKGVIRVKASKNADHVTVYIEDEGPGIPLEHQKNIFDSFYRIDRGMAQQVSGVGLGLAICQGFIRAHGGEIWLNPTDTGTCVAFTLPLAEKVSPKIMRNY